MTIHFIGVCGTAMATLAALLKRKGHDVQGSDENVYPPMSTFLESEKIRTLAGYSAEHITGDIDLVVVGNAISRGNVELEAVLDRKMRYCSLPEAVREHFLWSVAFDRHCRHARQDDDDVAGRLAARARRRWIRAFSSAASRAISATTGRAIGSGRGREFVIEGDEYDSAYFDKTAKFLKYLPDIAVINNVEFDHADIYADLDAVRLAFRRLVNLVPRSGLLLLGADSPDALALKKLAVSPRGDVRPGRVRRLAGDRCRRCRRRGSRSTCCTRGSRFGDDADAAVWRCTTSAMRWPRSPWRMPSRFQRRRSPKVCCSSRA